MPWARLDDDRHDHPKILELGDDVYALAAIGLLDHAITWASRHRKSASPGRVPWTFWRSRAGKHCKRLTDALVRVGLLDTDDEGIGLWIHDFDTYQAKRDPAEAAESGRRGARKRWTDSNSHEETDSNSHQSAIANNGSRAAAPAFPSRPVPSRPTQTPTESAAPTITQRSKRITDAYAEQVPLSNWPAVNGVVLKALKSERYADDEIACALLRLATDGRAVTVDVLRTELEGFGQRASPNKATERLNQGLAVVRRLEAQARGELA